MRKIAELLRIYLLNKVRSPLIVGMSILWGIGFFVFLYFVFESGGLNFGASSNFGSLFAASYVVFLPAYISISAVLNGLMEDSEKGLLKAYRSSRLTKAEYFASKIIAALISSLAISGMIMVLAFYLAGIGLNPAITFLAVTMTVVAHSGIAFLAASLSDDTQAIQMIVQFSMVIFVFGTPVFYPETLLPESIRMLQQLIPLTHSIQIVRAMVQGTLTTGILVKNLATLTGFSILLLGAAYRQFRF